MRVQLSLNISDENVIRVCQTLKETRELNSLVVRMLTAYTYDEQDMASVYGETHNVKPEEKDYSEEYAAIRDTLMTMDILIEDGKNLFDDSVNTFSEYMDRATEKEVYKSEETDTGGIKVVPRIPIKHKSAEASENSSVDTVEEKRKDAHGEESSDYLDIKLLREHVDKNFTKLGKDITELKEYLHINSPSKGSVQDDIDSIKAVIDAQPEVLEDIKEFYAEADSDASTDEPTIENVEPVVETQESGLELDSGMTFVAEAEDEGVSLEQSDEPVTGEASSAINDLLASLVQ